MAITETARRNHDELFPDRISTLARTDPELIERFDNFAFDEVLADSDLDIRTRLMVQLASLIACQAVGEFRVMAGAGLTIGLTPVELKEIVYQAVPYVGMGQGVRLPARRQRHAHRTWGQLPLPGQSTTTPATRLERGLAVQKQIVGSERVDAMYDTAPDDEQHLQRYLSGNCFGDYLTRSGIDVPVRELLTFAILASLGGCDAQVKGHVAANLNVGNDRARLLSVLTVLIPFIGYPRTLNALRALDEVTPADRAERTAP
jgi:4-carboxymuconolactone decarboxylase